jgi:hypothetical protein
MAFIAHIPTFVNFVNFVDSEYLTGVLDHNRPAGLVSYRSQDFRSTPICAGD